jgi:hypothetical protein
MSETRSAIDDEDGAAAPRRGRRLLRLGVFLAVTVVVATGITLAFDTSAITTFFAVLLGLVILRAGWFFLQSFATPPPPPPESGTLRKVKLVYRCSICGAEVRMTAAPSEEPEAPRHCMEDMDLVSPID